MEIDVRKCVCARAPGVCVRAPVPLLAGGQVYVSETVCTVDDVKDIVHFIAAKPEDVPLGQAPPNSRSLCLGLSLPGWKEGGRGKGQIWQMGQAGFPTRVRWPDKRNFVVGGGLGPLPRKGPGWDFQAGWENKFFLETLQLFKPFSVVLFICCCLIIYLKPEVCFQKKRMLAFFL